MILLTVVSIPQHLPCQPWKHVLLSIHIRAVLLRVYPFRVQRCGFCKESWGWRSEFETQGLRSLRCTRPSCNSGSALQRCPSCIRRVRVQCFAFSVAQYLGTYKTRNMEPLDASPISTLPPCVGSSCLTFKLLLPYLTLSKRETVQQSLTLIRPPAFTIRAFSVLRLAVSGPLRNFKPETAECCELRPAFLFFAFSVYPFAFSVAGFIISVLGLGLPFGVVISRVGTFHLHPLLLR